LKIREQKVSGILREESGGIRAPKAIPKSILMPSFSIQKFEIRSSVTGNISRVFETPMFLVGVLLLLSFASYFL